jgi:hypothetical protein
MAITVWKKSGLLFAFGALCSASETLRVKIPIVVYDGAELVPKTLSSAENLAGTILLTSGLEAEWSAGPIADLKRLVIDFTPRTGGECASVPSPRLLRVQLLRQAPASLSPQVLGFSLPRAMNGIQVSIYADRVAEVSQRMAPTFGQVLGYALAHELGHVLLHSLRHENSGLMKGVWSKGDWQRAAATIIPFSPEQARRILEAIQGAKICTDGPAGVRAQPLNHLASMHRR